MPAYLILGLPRPAIYRFSPLGVQGPQGEAGSGGGGGVTDHGALTGLADDDHAQYHTNARGDARYPLIAHTHDDRYFTEAETTEAIATHVALTTVHGISAFGATLVDDTTEAAARTTLGLGTLATQAASGVSITGGSIAGIVDLAIADGGTGASTIGAARDNLGLGSAAVADAGDFDTAGSAEAAANNAAASLTAHSNDTTAVHGIADTAALYVAGGTDVAVADGGTGSSTSAGARTALGLVIGTDVQAYNAGLGQIAGLADPNADGILFWDDSAGAFAFLTAGSGVTITGTTITASGSSGNSFETIQPQNGGTNGTAVVADSATDTLTLNAAAGCNISSNAGTDTITIESPGQFMTPYYDIADVYLCAGAGASNSVTLTANRLYASRITVHERRTFTTLAIVVTTAVAASTVRLGLANHSATYGVGTLVVDGGTVSTATTGIKTVTISQTLIPDTYFTLLVADTAGLAVIGGAAAGCIGEIGRKFTASTGHAVVYVYRTFTAGPFGDETANSFTEGVNAVVPLVGVR